MNSVVTRTNITITAFLLAAIAKLIVGLVILDALRAFEKPFSPSHHTLMAIGPINTIVDWLFWITLAAALLNALNWICVAAARLRLHLAPETTPNTWQIVFWCLCPVINLYQPCLTINRFWQETRSKDNLKKSTLIEILTTPAWIFWTIGIWGLLALQFYPKTTYDIYSVVRAIQQEIRFQSFELVFLALIVLSLLPAIAVINGLTDKISQEPNRTPI